MVLGVPAVAPKFAKPRCKPPQTVFVHSNHERSTNICKHLSGPVVGVRLLLWCCWETRNTHRFLTQNTTSVAVVQIYFRWRQVLVCAAHRVRKFRLEDATARKSSSTRGCNLLLRLIVQHRVHRFSFDLSFLPHVRPSMQEHFTKSEADIETAISQRPTAPSRARHGPKR